MNVVLIGCGNIGIKRIKSIIEEGNSHIVGLVETNPIQIEYLRNEFRFPVYNHYRELIQDTNLNACIISTPPFESFNIIRDCLESGKHILCEKPLGKNLDEAELLTDIALKNNLVMKCGFNLRHDEGLQKALNLIKNDEIGKIYFMKCTYVNGTVLVNSNRVGSLLDMGTHVIDLAKWFIGDLKIVKSALHTYEYCEKELDDNGFVIFRNENITGTLHFSFTRWMNSFNLEICGEKGLLEVNNLPKWGVQNVIHFIRKYPAGVPEKRVYSFQGDKTWLNEWKEFSRCVISDDLKWNMHGLETMRVADKIKKSSL